MKKIFLDGFLGKVTMVVKPNINSDTIVILLHGAYGYPFHSKKTRYQILSNMLTQKYSVAYYETSRRFRWCDKPHLLFEDYSQQAFEKKEFVDEYVEVLKAVKSIMVSMGNKSRVRRVVLVGFSLGGIMSILLSKDLPFITDIFTFGTALSFSLPSTWPLFNSMVSTGKIIANLSQYNGNISIVYGLEDELSDLSKVEKLFDAAKNARVKRLELIKGVDHRFLTLDGVEAEAKLNQLIFEYIDGQLDRDAIFS